MKQRILKAKGKTSEEAKAELQRQIMHVMRSSSWAPKNNEILVYKEDDTFIAEVSLYKCPPCSY